MENNSTVMSLEFPHSCMSDDSPDQITDVSQIDQETADRMEGVVIDDGEPRFTVEVVDNTGAPPYEE